MKDYIEDFAANKNADAKDAVVKTAPKSVVPDMVQVTILLDRSSSMRGTVWMAAIKALADLKVELDVSLLSIQYFNGSWDVAKEFDGDEVQGFMQPSGETNLYGALIKSIGHSRKAASCTPEFAAHHVFVIITDGQSNTHTDEEKAQAMEEVKKMDVEATFFLLDSSPGQIAGNTLGWLSTPFARTPQAIIDAIGKVRTTVNQLADNVSKKLSPTSGLMLPPAQ
jgi:hypothetical protein